MAAAWTRSYWAAWAVWVGVVSVAYVGILIVLDPSNLRGCWHQLWRFAVAGMIVAPICWRLSRGREDQSAILAGLLGGMGSMALIGTILFFLGHDAEGRAFVAMYTVAGAMISGIGGAIIGIMNRREE